MFPRRYFAGRYYAPRYWPPASQAPPSTPAATPLLRAGLVLPLRKDGLARGADLSVAWTLLPGTARGNAAAAGAVIDAAMPHNGRAAGTVLPMVAATLQAGGARGQTAYDRSLIDADLLALSNLL